MDLSNINAQWIWIAAAIIAVLLVIALFAAVARRRAARILPLTAGARERFQGDWRRIEEMFVDRPATAVAQADELVNELIRTRGLNVNHSRVAHRYRAGHAVVERHARGKASTEDLRQALLKYRALYEDLAVERSDVPTEITTAAEVASPQRAVGGDVVPADERPRA